MLEADTTISLIEVAKPNLEIRPPILSRPKVEVKPEEVPPVPLKAVDNRPTAAKSEPIDLPGSDSELADWQPPTELEMALRFEPDILDSEGLPDSQFEPINSLEELSEPVIVLDEEAKAMPRVEIVPEIVGQEVTSFFAVEPKLGQLVAEKIAADEIAPKQLEAAAEIITVIQVTQAHLELLVADKKDTAGLQEQLHELYVELFEALGIEYDEVLLKQFIELYKAPNADTEEIVEEIENYDPGTREQKFGPSGVVNAFAAIGQHVTYILGKLALNSANIQNAKA